MGKYVDDNPVFAAVGCLIIQDDDCDLMKKIRRIGQKDWEIILAEASGAPPEPSLFD